MGGWRGAGERRLLGGMGEIGGRGLLKEASLSSPSTKLGLNVGNNVAHTWDCNGTLTAALLFLLVYVRLLLGQWWSG